MNNLARLGERNRSWEVFGDFDDLMGHWFRAPTMVQREGNAKAPAMDVSESESAFMVKAEVPGVPREDLDVTINDGVLTISAERQIEKKDEEKSGRLIRQEAARCGCAVAYSAVPWRFRRRCALGKRECVGQCGGAPKALGPRPGWVL